MIAGLATIAAALITGIVTVWITVLKLKSGQRTEEQDRQDRLEERILSLEMRVDEEITLRRDAQAHAHTLTLALERALDWIVRVMRWIESGASPPPPQPPDIESLHAALAPRPRRPPD